jgi:hypothetical protein
MKKIVKGKQIGGRVRRIGMIAKHQCLCLLLGWLLGAVDSSRKY